jgi:hypothetical protein
MILCRKENREKKTEVWEESFHIIWSACVSLFKEWVDKKEERRRQRKTIEFGSSRSLSHFVLGVSFVDQRVRVKTDFWKAIRFWEFEDPQSWKIEKKNESDKRNGGLLNVDRLRSFFNWLVNWILYFRMCVILSDLHSKE